MILASLTLGGCAKGPGREPLERQIPAAPSYLKAVSVPDPKAGESALVVAQRERQGRKRANTIIINMHGWYLDVRKSYSGKKDVE